MRFHFRTGVPLVIATTLLAACGESMPTDYKPILATISGTISSNEPSSSSAKVRVALLWATNADSWADKHTKHVVAQDVAITSVSLPATFELAITDLPPTNAMDHGAAGGAVVAYRDVNHNGKLDFTPPDAERFVDEVLAYDSDLVIWYFDPEEKPGFIPGFSTSKGSIDNPITLTQVPAAASCHLLEWELQDPENGPAGPGPWREGIGVVHMNYCPDSPVYLPPGSAGVEVGDGAGAPPPETTELMCEVPHSSDGISDAYAAFWGPTNMSDFVRETCGPLQRTCRSLRVTGTMPAEWPCPCDPNRFTCRDPI